MSEQEKEINEEIQTEDIKATEGAAEAASDNGTESEKSEAQDVEGRAEEKAGDGTEEAEEEASESKEEKKKGFFRKDKKIKKMKKLLN